MYRRQKSKERFEMEIRTLAILIRCGIIPKPKLKSKLVRKPYIPEEYDFLQIKEFVDKERPRWLAEEAEIEKIFKEEYERTVMLEAEMWYEEELNKRDIEKRKKEKRKKDKEMDVFLGEFFASFEK